MLLYLLQNYMVKISVIINTYNEERYIERCLKNLLWADEIIIIDMYSSDNTVNIAKKYTKNIYFHKREISVLYARNFSLTKANYNWVFIVDPDEIVPFGLVNKLKEVAENNLYDAVSIPFQLFFLNRPLYYAYPITYKIRFFKKNVANFPKRVHSQPIINGNILTLEVIDDYIVKHYSVDTIGSFLKKILRYTKDEARHKFFSDNIKFNLYKLIKTPIAEFYYRFFVNKGFRDGFLGFVFCIFMSIYNFLIYFRLFFIQYLNGERKS